MNDLDRLSIGTDPHTRPSFDHPARYACPNTIAALQDTDAAVPPFGSTVDRLVAFARERPDVRDGPMI